MEEMNLDTVAAQTEENAEGVPEASVAAALSPEEGNFATASESEAEAFSERDGLFDGEETSDVDEESVLDSHRACAEEDLLALQREFPEMRGRSLADLPSPRRFGELRELGLSPREAYLATSESRVTVGGKAHLRAARPTHSVSRTGTMTAGELRQAASLFPKLSGREIVQLYKRVASPRN